MSDIRDWDVDNYVKMINQTLEHKLFYMTPNYTNPDNSENNYYRRGEIPSQTVETNDYGDQYFVVPKLDASSMSAFLSGKYFNINGWDREVFGFPKYILNENTIYTAFELEGNPDDYESYRMAGKQYATIQLENWQMLRYVVDLDYGKTENNVYVSKNLIATAKPEKAIKEQPAETEVPNSMLVNKDFEYYNEKEEKSILESFQRVAISLNLYYDADDIFNFHTCLKSSFITILAGMSGTGKTKLPLQYAEYFKLRGSDKDALENLLFIPVSPAYTEPSDILGFLNPETGCYVHSETGLVNFLIRASQNKNQMYMVIFDEMNLAPIEHYFAPFLSVLEKSKGDRKIKLYEKPKKVDPVPSGKGPAS